MALECPLRAAFSTQKKIGMHRRKGKDKEKEIEKKEGDRAPVKEKKREKRTGHIPVPRVSAHTHVRTYTDVAQLPFIK